MDKHEQRRRPRKRTLYNARVVFNNRFSIIECTVRDLSEAGARISFSHPTPLPAEVELEVFKIGQSFRARVMWSEEKSHGLMFINEGAQAAVLPTATFQPSSEGVIQAILDQARHRIAQEVGVSPETVRLKLEIDRWDGTPRK